MGLACTDQEKAVEAAFGVGGCQSTGINGNASEDRFFLSVLTRAPCFPVGLRLQGIQLVAHPLADNSLEGTPATCWVDLFIDVPPTTRAPIYCLIAVALKNV
jgi:hypothetical protein